MTDYSVLTSDTTIPTGTLINYLVSLSPSNGGCNLTNNGQIDNIATSSGWGAIAIGYESGVFWNHYTITNTGLIEADASAVSGTQGIAISNYGGGWSINVTNTVTGQIIAKGDINALGLLANTLTNAGTISATAAHSGQNTVALGAYMASGENSGTITASSDYCAYGVSLNDYYIGRTWYAPRTFVNTGTITATSTGTNYSYGLSFLAESDSTPFQITNYGTIQGYYSIWDSNRVSGGTDYSVAEIVNYGSLIGNVALGANDDSFDNERGTVTGLVDGGDGSNTVVFNCSNVTGNLSFTAPADTTTPITLPDGTRVVNFQNYGMKGGSGNNTFIGGAGNDTFWGGTGTNYFDGGGGSNTINFANAAAVVTINLAATGAQNVGNAQGTYTLTHVQNIVASPYGGTYTGDADANTFTGSGGADTFIAGTGNATFLMGGSFTAADRLQGGPGSDTAILSGDYSSGVTLSASDFSGIEKLVLHGMTNGYQGIDQTNYAYKFTAAPDLLAAGQTLNIISPNLGRENLSYFYFDGSAVTNGSFNIQCEVNYPEANNGIPTGSPGSNGTIITGSGNDVIDCSLCSGIYIDASRSASVTITASWNSQIYMGASLDASDKVHGAAMVLNGDYSKGVVLTSNVSDADLILTAGHSYAFTAQNGFISYSVVGGMYGNSIVDGSALGAGDSLTVDASTLTTPGLIINGGAGNDVITVGTGNETIDGGGGLNKVVYSGNYSAYTITHNSDGSMTVSGSGATDTLTHIQQLAFSDRTVTIQTAPHASSDFNGDGKSDILFQNTDGSVGMWQMNGATVLGANPVGSNPGSAWRLMGTGDFNADAKSDILFQNTDG